MLLLCRYGIKKINKLMSNQNLTLYLILFITQIITCSVRTTGRNNASLNVLCNNIVLFYIWKQSKKCKTLKEFLIILWCSKIYQDTARNLHVNHQIYMNNELQKYEMLELRYPERPEPVKKCPSSMSTISNLNSFHNDTNA